MVERSRLCGGRRADCVLENHSMGSEELLFTNSCNTSTERNWKIGGAAVGSELLALAASGGGGDRESRRGSKRDLSNSWTTVP